MIMIIANNRNGDENNNGNTDNDNAHNNKDNNDSDCNHINQCSYHFLSLVL